MATKYQYLLLFLLLLAFQEMMIMRVEAALCEGNSRLFRGICFSNRNCGAICEKEGFINGQCKFLKCICSKDCNIGSGGGGGGGGGGGIPGGGPPDEGPPADGPPEEGPPAGGPPEEGPPADGPSEEGPPADGPPQEGPPADGPPEEGPPGDSGPPDEGAPGGQKQHVINRKSLLN